MPARSLPSVQGGSRVWFEGMVMTICGEDVWTGIGSTACLLSIVSSSLIQFVSKK